MADITLKVISMELSNDKKKIPVPPSVLWELVKVFLMLNLALEIILKDNLNNFKFK